MKPRELAKWVTTALLVALLLLPASIQLAWLVIFTFRCLPIALEEQHALNK